VPAWNYYTHGTHITVAHAMGATIGINTMLLFASVFYIIQSGNSELPSGRIKLAGSGILIANISLLIFWIAMLGSGIAKIMSKQNSDPFSSMMEKIQPWFKVFTYSGTFVFVGLFIMIIATLRIMNSKKN
jgi:nitric oxide reductase subunit B